MLMGALLNAVCVSGSGFASGWAMAPWLLPLVVMKNISLLFLLAPTLMTAVVSASPRAHLFRQALLQSDAKAIMRPVGALLALVGVSGLAFLLCGVRTLHMRTHRKTTDVVQARATKDLS